MSGFANNADSNMKQVMRTALVGVSPADQLMLKGYLRVLLRLEADLEWVPANHAQVDLLFINEDFRNSDSVKRILRGDQTPVLFVKRDPDGQGRLTGDRLILPLKQLDILSDWLAQNLGVLASNAGSQSRRQPDRATDTPVTSYSATRTSAPVQSVTEATPQAGSDATAYEGLIDFAKKVNERAEGIHELAVNGKPIGLADLKNQKIWLTTSARAKFDASWQLNKVNKPAPNEVATDLFQWLWDQVWQAPKPVSPLISETQVYQLRYWPKPSSTSERRELLSVFTALEQAPKTIAEIALLADTSVNMVKRIIAGLLISGGLQSTSYSQLTANQLTENAKPKPVSNVTANDAQTQAPVSTGSALDDALARRASGQTSQVSSSIDLAASGLADQRAGESAQQPVASSNNSQKRGFLSKLRNKLGL